ncbi:hypothetical protein [Micromonospora sp. WMMD1082]|uniref:hypothetical protein n=1 Tax=Micromonospora sp. WMMD1082 TaxID=3016104 RepID=UPI0024180A6C|nr:hypothetical protein [Micromonospora sp. WMMD1082]MDG4796917.1 hypothetical protein [Micromonospora sp. WMMD1082]
MNRWEIILGVVLGLFVNEVTDISPWIARKLVRWSAYRWTTNPEIAAEYAEEWTALINDRPGMLPKLLTAMRFSVGAAGRAAPRIIRNRLRAARRIGRRSRSPRALLNMLSRDQRPTVWVDRIYLTQGIDVKEWQVRRADIVVDDVIIYQVKPTPKHRPFRHPPR